ncbi:MAG TPA: acylphosphatase [Thermoplasmata archaeon]|nr:acylphosphatase [Thermoplasmata archaeon]
MKRVHVKIYGRVQGVWFRANTKEKAEEVGVGGWVRNMPDGSVEAVFEGKDEKVEKMIEWCRHGPPLARVDRVEVRYEDLKGEKNFRIIY